MNAVYRINVTTHYSDYAHSAANLLEKILPRAAYSFEQARRILTSPCTIVLYKLFKTILYNTN